MKTKCTIYGDDYEIEIKARDLRKSRMSDFATKKVCQWLEARLWELSHELSGYTYDEVKEFASNLHNVTYAKN